MAATRATPRGDAADRVKLIDVVQLGRQTPNSRLWTHRNLKKFCRRQAEPSAFTPLAKPLSQASVAIATSASLHRPDQDRFSPSDTGFRALDRGDRAIVMGHWSPNFDHTGFQLDLNVVYPIDRLRRTVARSQYR